jgi:protoporphyrinogen/coproporphyrinogen III oxidase
MLELRRVAIIGGGIAGLTVAHQLLRRSPEIQLTLLERSPALGGVIGTVRQDAYLVELGPNGFLDSKSEIIEFCDQLGLSGELERASQAAAERFILIDGRLRRAPKTPSEFLKSDVLTTKGKLRFLWERFSGQASTAEDESIADFGKRHFGVEATNNLFDAVVTGIYAGDIEKLSIRTCFPKLVEFEQRYGSLLKAQSALARVKRKAGNTSGIGTLTCPIGGMGRLIERLQASFDDIIHTGTAVERIERIENGWRINAGSQRFEADVVVLAVPSHVAAGFVDAQSELSKELTEIESAPAAVAAMAFKRSELHAAPIGFGFLAPERLGRPVLGIIYSSNVFANQAPADEFMFRAILGGDRRRDVVEWSDDRLIQAVRDDLLELLGITAKPTFQFVRRWRHAIPQYHIGHAARLQRIDEQLKQTPGLYLTGASYRGVSVADCVKDGMAVAEQVAQYLESAASRKG